MAVFALTAISAMASDLTGYVIDKKCSSNKAMLGNEKCAQSCIKRGDSAVIVTDDGKIYAVSNQDKVVPLAGKKVTVSGKISGETITVDTVSATT